MNAPRASVLSSAIAFRREAVEPTPARERQPSRFVSWLDNYFRQTPEERMQDEYLAYWG